MNGLPVFSFDMTDDTTITVSPFAAELPFDTMTIPDAVDDAVDVAVVDAVVAAVVETVTDVVVVVVAVIVGVVVLADAVVTACGTADTGPT